MRPVYHRDQEVADFVAGNIRFCGGFDKFTAIGVADRGALVGGFVFHDYCEDFGVVEMSFAATSRRWLTRSILFAVFDYVFNQLGCQMACSRTPASQGHILRMLRAYGFKQVTVPRLFGRGEDGIISSLTAEDWRSNGFHKENAHGQRQPKSAEAA